MLRACKLFVVLLAAAISLLSTTALTYAAEFPGASGMALIDDTHFLIVQDTKYDQSGDRLGILSVDPLGGYHYLPLTVDWPVRPAHDLESCYGFRTRPGEFLAAESGAYHQDWQNPESELYQGRIWHLKVTGGESGWQVEVLTTYDIPWELHEIEGMFSLYMSASFGSGSYMPQFYGSNGVILDSDKSMDSMEQGTESSIGGWDDPQIIERGDPVGEFFSGSTGSSKPAIVLVTRGGEQPYEPATFYWGYVDFDAGTLEFNDAGLRGRALQSQTNPGQPWTRGCSDIYVDNQGVLWVATTQDASDAGPFRSTVYRYGAFDQTQAFSLMGASPVMPGEAKWVLDGFKIEALGAPVIAGSVLSFATDDEGFGGIWRPLGPPVSQYWF
jgi:hypothetical protein